MIQSYLKTAFRHLLRYKAYSFINLFGLALGILAVMLVGLFIRDELRYDRHHRKADRIYRLVEDLKIDGVGEEASSQPLEVAPALLTDFPDVIEHAVRFFNLQAPFLTMQVDDRVFNEKRFFFADSTVFDVFDFEIVRGHAESFRQPGALFLTESTAKKYFDDRDPMGKAIRFDDRFDLHVAGIIKDFPTTSHFQADMLCSFATTRWVYPIGPPGYGNFYWNPAWTYLLLREGVSPHEVEARMPAFVKKYFKAVPDARLWLQPLTDIHLYSHLDFEIEANGDVAQVVIFGMIGILMLTIATFNFVNLTTARIGTRLKEVGLRKTVGADPHDMRQQFFGESLLLSFMSGTLGLMALEPVLPLFNGWTGKHFDSSVFTEPFLYLLWLGSCGAIGFLAGIYPAMVVSRFRPVRIFRNLQGGSYKSRFRNVLVVAQFTMAIFLIIGTLVIDRQLRFLQQASLGFDKDQILVIPIQRTAVSAQYDAFRESLRQHSSILQVTATEDILGWKYQTGNYRLDGQLQREDYQLPRLYAHYDFPETFSIPLAAGRSLSREHPADVEDGILINEAAARYFGWTPEEAVGRKFLIRRPSANRDTQREPQRVIRGVLKDFHFASLRQKIGPLIIELPRSPYQQSFFIKFIAVKIRGQQTHEAIALIEQTWKRFAPNRPLEFSFLDQNLRQIYQAEASLNRVTTVLSTVTVVIAALGLLGLAIYMVERRTKEIGIRKVVGAREWDILQLVIKDFLGLILVATLIAWPLAYTASSQWLGGFAYRAPLSPVLFVAASGLAVAVAILTVSWQAWRAARMQPVKVLKYE